MREAVSRLRGSFTLVAVHADAPETIVGVRRNSPLVVGLGDGENFMASDVAAFIDYTKRAVELGQDEIITMTPTGISIIGFRLEKRSLLRSTQLLGIQLLRKRVAIRTLCSKKSLNNQRRLPTL
jgi:glucosamine 6-phosphate synthetase-like amidotransferase/phosphosugar isomerase protein